MEKVVERIAWKGCREGYPFVQGGEHVSLSNISDEGCWIESKHGGEVGEQQKEKPVKCKWCAEEKSMEKHGEHMKEIQKLLLKRRVEAEASPLKRTNGVAAHENKSAIIFEEEVETKRMKKQVNFAGVTSIVQVTDTDCSKSFKREMQTAGRSN